MKKHKYLVKVSEALRQKEIGVFTKILAERKRVVQQIEQIDDDISKGWNSTYANITDSWKLEQSWKSMLYRKRSLLVQTLRHLDRLEQQSYSQAKNAVSRHKALAGIVEMQKEVKNQSILKLNEDRLGQLSILRVVKTNVF